jgi:hypothetical protein
MSMARENEEEMENVSHSKPWDWESALSTSEGSDASAPWQMKHPSTFLAVRTASPEKKRRAHSLHNGVFSTTKMAKRRVY